MNPQHDPLTRAAIRHGSDKYGCHIYTPVYHSLFAELQEAPIRLLEIGVGGYDSPAAGGLGLKMWADYFPYAQITGLDLRPKTLDLSPRVQVFQGSQDDPGVLANLAERRGPFDIVIDDGSHVVSHVMQSFRTLYPLMQPSGFYIVEDAQTSFMPGLGGNAGGTGTIFDVAHRVSLAMHRLEGHVAVEPDLPEVAFGSITQSVAIYRNMVVFRRGPNTMSSNMTLALDQPEVRKVLDEIAAEAELNPSSGSYLTRIDMLIWGQRVDLAAALALEAAERYPTDWHVLAELVRLMEWAGQRAAQDTISGRLETLQREAGGFAVEFGNAPPPIGQEIAGPLPASGAPPGAVDRAVSLPVFIASNS